MKRSVNWLKFVWCFGIIVSLIASGYFLYRGKSVETNIMALMPTHTNATLVTEASNRLASKFEDRVNILLGAESAHSAIEAQRGLVEELTSSSLYRDIQTLNLSQAHHAPTNMLGNAHFYMTDLDRQQVGQPLVMIEQALRSVQFPAQQSQFGFAEDPFDFFDRWWQTLTPKLDVEFVGDALVLKHEQRFFALVSFRLTQNPFQLGYQKEVISHLDLQLSALPSSIEVVRSGLIFHAYEGSRQAILEMNTIGIGSLVFVTVILLLTFRRLAALWFAVVAVSSGISCAFFVSVLIFTKVHIITLAFGASLIGIAIDYALHYMVAVRGNRQSSPTLIWALGLALVSSVCTFALQGLTPLPGLKQIAVFTVVGLAAAWLTVVVFGQWVSLRQIPVSELTVSTSKKLLTVLSGKRTLRIFIGVSLVLLSVFVLKPPVIENDLRLLNSSPAALLKQEQQLVKVLNAPESSRFFLVQADTEQEWLHRNEYLAAELVAFQEQGTLSSFDSVSHYILSKSKQAQNEQAWLLAYDITNPESAIQQLSLKLGASLENIAAVQSVAQSEPLSFSDIDDPSFRQRFEHLVLNDPEDKAYASVVTITGFNIENGGQFKALAAKLEGVFWVDSIASISTVLQQQNQSVLIWLAVAYLMVALLMLPRYRHKTWCMMLPSLLASLLTVAMMSWFSLPLNLFSSIALLLILGIGLDMAIMLSETTERVHAWLASSLSVLTSMAAFGLLALSNTPVLHYFGLSIIIGLPLVWVLTPSLLQYSSKVCKGETTRESS